MMNLRAAQEEMVEFARAHDSAYAYRFYFPQDLDEHEDLRGREHADLIEVRGFADGTYTSTLCDRAGRSIHQPKPAQPDDVPYQVGSGGVTLPSARPSIREDIRREERERAQREVKSQELLRAAEAAKEELKQRAAERLERLDVEAVVPVQGEPAPAPPNEPVTDEAVKRSLWRQIWGM